MEKASINKLDNKKQSTIKDYFPKKPNEEHKTKTATDYSNINLQNPQNPCDNEDISSLNENKEEYGILYEYRTHDGVTKLKNKKTNLDFIFTNQNDYQAIGEYVIDYVDKRITQFNMDKLWVPSDSEEKSLCNFKKPKSIPQCHIFVSKNFEEENKKLLVLIQGTGAVRAGIWSRSVCINDSLEKGSVIPFLEFAEKNDYQVIIMNPNERYSTNPNSKAKKRIDDFSSMEKHCVWVWQKIIEKYSKSTEIHLVAHSMGGVCTVEILRNAFKSQSINRIKKIAFTDAVHGQSLRNLIVKKYLPDELQMNMVHFVTHKGKAGLFISDNRSSYDGIFHCSAGHTKHEFTTGYAFEEIVKFFQSHNIFDYIESNKNKGEINIKTNSNENHENPDEELFTKVEQEIQEISINNEADNKQENAKPINNINSAENNVNSDDIIVEIEDYNQNKMDIE